MTQITMMVIIYLEPDILEWALRSITLNKTKGGDGVPAELFQILKYDAVKVLHSNLELSSGHRTGKSQFSFQSQRKTMPENVQTTIQLCSFHILARLHSKSFKLGFNRT